MGALWIPARAQSEQYLEFSIYSVVTSAACLLWTLIDSPPPARFDPNDSKGVSIEDIEQGAASSVLLAARLWPVPVAMLATSTVD